MSTINLGLAAALRDVINERFRQIESEGFDAAHDDEHRLGDLARAAACYALTVEGALPTQPPILWPWSDAWWKPKSRRRDLVRATALLLAEIERLDRQPSRAALDTLIQRTPTS